jgi:CRISPR-associated protein Cas5h
LKGKTAVFRKPDINDEYYISYSWPPLSSIYGILGSILGFSGYSKQYLNNKISKSNKKDKKKIRDESLYPEFYNKLKDIFVAIKPDSKIPRKEFITYNNFHGYGSDEIGGNLIVREQTIIDFKVTIYLYGKDNNYLIEELFNRLSKKNTIFTPYLGKNEHRADIENVQKIENFKEIRSIEELDNWINIETIFPCNSKKPNKLSLLKLDKESNTKLEEKSSQEEEKYNIFEVYENYPFCSVKNRYLTGIFAFFYNKKVNKRQISQKDVFKFNRNVKILKKDNKVYYLFNGLDPNILE